MQNNLVHSRHSSLLCSHHSDIHRSMTCRVFIHGEFGHFALWAPRTARKSDKSLQRSHRQEESSLHRLTQSRESPQSVSRYLKWLKESGVTTKLNIRLGSRTIPAVNRGSYRRLCKVSHLAVHVGQTNLELSTIAVQKRSSSFVGSK